MRPSARLRLPLAVLPLVSLLVCLPACRSVAVRGGPTWDAGTVGVSGTESGVGAQGEVIAFQGPWATGTGFGPALSVVGYSSAGDADPIAVTSFEIRLRRELGSEDGRGLYWELGSGLGAAWTPTLNRAVVPLHGELGLQARIGGGIVSVGVRERILGMGGSGSPPLDVLNSVQAVVSLGFGGGP